MATLKPVVSFVLLMALCTVACIDSDNEDEGWSEFLYRYGSEARANYVSLLQSQALDGWVSDDCNTNAPEDGVYFTELIEASRLAQRKGDYSTALHHRICLHIFGGPNGGIRSASLVVHWGNLAEVYPKAKEALEELHRMARLNTLDDTNVSHWAFNDYYALSDILGMPEAPEILAQEFEGASPRLEEYMRERLTPTPESKVLEAFERLEIRNAGKPEE